MAKNGHFLNLPQQEQGLLRKIFRQVSASPAADGTLTPVPGLMEQ